MTPDPAPAAPRSTVSLPSQPQSAVATPYTPRTVFDRFLGSAPSALSTVTPPDAKIAARFDGPLVSAKLPPLDEAVLAGAINGPQAFARYRTSV